MFVVVRLATILSDAWGAHTLSTILGYSWLAFCAYSWFAPGLFRKMLEKELKEVELRQDF